MPLKETDLDSAEVWVSDEISHFEIHSDNFEEHVMIRLMLDELLELRTAINKAIIKRKFRRK